MSGINFMVDAHGQKTAVIIDLRRHKNLWEDFYDVLLVQARHAEPREGLEDVRRRLKRKHLARG